MPCKENFPSRPSHTGDTQDALQVIAHIETDFPTKFGVPRQSGLVNGLSARVVFTPEYRNPDALRGLEGFSHIWLLWDFSLAHDGKPWRPTVRPPRLGGNRRMGVWATRSPFRPNHIGLSCVRVRSISLHTPLGPVIEVDGADLVSGTPILDIKPYLPYVDSHPEATGGFAQEQNERTKPLEVEMADPLVRLVPPEKRQALNDILASDPRPHYQDNPERTYVLPFAEWEVSFRVSGGTLLVTDIKYVLSP
ncbi:MAG TPA: tRNA (N6-threonylcarbamoyladenosine(37)-N6)-methyltransferase TrmO [Prevotellaceae bacterium]|nr:tRNA (N6-threonylcarbamoyladenosine(37)-N6)-methyltransferase TrmO [Prevotellaceae bacterium]